MPYANRCKQFMNSRNSIRLRSHGRLGIVHRCAFPLLLAAVIQSATAAAADVATARSGSFGTNAPLTIPAATAYLEPDRPDRGGARVSSRSGEIQNWTDPSTRVLWFGSFTNAGLIDASIQLRLAQQSESKLRLTVSGEAREIIFSGQGTNPATARFGDFNLVRAGYHRFTLESLNPLGQSAGEIVALKLGGPAAASAHFNLKPRRNAASVHLGYPVPSGTNVAAFYCEMTGIDDPIYTYYMACGWHRGYFGMQVNSPTERRIIFSVWDSGNEGVDRKKVADENRVTLLAKGEDVNAGDFGNEGTGGHSHLKFQWRTGEVQRFLVTAQPTNQTFTIYSGYYFHPDRKAWMLISSWRAPKDGGWLRGLYSFSENFGGSNGHLRRKALYGRQWIRTSSGEWQELTTARFTHDGTGKADRLDRFMGLENGRFFLSHGGFVDGYSKSGERLSRPPASRPPELEQPLPKP